MIKYVKGDATNPQGEGIKVIAHCCNNLGGWGRGFVLALSKKWAGPKNQYNDWALSARCETRGVKKIPFALGETQIVQVEPEIFVANMIGQYGIYEQNGVPPIRYDAIRECLKKVCKFAKEHNASIHSPRFGAGLAGGRWSEIEKIITEELVARGVEVTIYDL